MSFYDIFHLPRVPEASGRLPDRRVTGSGTACFAVSQQFRKLPEAFRKGYRKVISYLFFYVGSEASGSFPEAVPEAILQSRI